MSDTQKQFRNYKEMDAVYQQLHADGLTDEPYLIKLARGNQRLTFFGCHHSNDAHDKQNMAIEAEWQLFITSKNKQKITFCEGGIRPLEADKGLAIEKYSEPGLLTWLAHRDDVQLVSPEPDAAAEIAYLFLQQFTVSDIMTYYFGRQMLQWLQADHMHNPDWKLYAEYHTSFYASLEPLREERIDLAKTLMMFQATTGEAFSETNEKLLYTISTPSSNAVSAASGDYRNISLFEAIRTAWTDGLDIFTLYGSGHAIVLEPALLTLFS